MRARPLRAAPACLSYPFGDDFEAEPVAGGLTMAEETWLVWAIGRISVDDADGMVAFTVEFEGI